MTLVLFSFNVSPDAVRRSLVRLRQANPQAERSFWTLFANAREFDKDMRLNIVNSAGVTAAGCLPVEPKKESTALDLSRLMSRRRRLDPHVVASVQKATALASAGSLAWRGTRAVRPFPTLFFRSLALLIAFMGVNCTPSGEPPQMLYLCRLKKFYSSFGVTSAGYRESLQVGRSAAFLEMYISW